ncbi:MAG: sigma-70 family RNA polymerase sigma factor [Phycisphaerae bacterium]|nr:sigma-70 family RNA polymerase sigma factor [Phycisphaerae bacterium]
MEHIKSTPLLTAQEERQLARLVREHSDPIARERMIQSNLLLVVKIAKEFSNNGMSLNDLVAEGNLGLMRAVEEFDPDAGVRFSTYAAWWIKQSIKKARINSAQPIHIPAYLAKLINRWRKTSREMEAHLGHPPTFEQVARRMKISRRKADAIQQGLTAVNAPSQIGSEEAQAASEMLSDDDTAAPDQRLLDDSTGPIVQAVLGRLEDRSRQILILRFHMDGYQGEQRTYKQIGKIIGLTRERVRQLEKEALQQLKAVIDEYI